MSLTIKHGYKQTEVGVIPEDWELKRIGEFSAIKTGPFGTLLKASEYSESQGVPLISVGEIREGYLRVTAETPRVSKTVTKRLPQYILKEGDIVFGRKGGVERSALIKSSQDGWFLGSDGISIRPSKKLCALYLGLQFQSHRITEWLLQNAIGTTMASLNQAILENAVVPIPPTLAEQEAIAEALSDADALIESLEQLIAKKRQIKQGAMQELLTGKKRLPGFQIKPNFKQTEVGLLPEDWEVKPFSEIGKLTKGRGLLKEDIKRHGAIPAIPYTALYTDFSEVLDHNLIKWFVDSEIQTVIVREPCLLLASSSNMEANTGKASALIGTRPVAIGREVIIFKPLSDCKFLSYLLSTQAYRSKTLTLARGTTIKHLYPATFQDYRVAQPPLPEQIAISKVLSDMDDEITNLESKLAKARQVKEGMMQELLTGNIRLI